jgi:uncharacterized protein (DUF305 family)
MTTTSTAWRAGALLLALVLAAGCASEADETGTADAAGPPIVQPGAPGESGRTLLPEEAAALEQLPHTEHDTRFMQGMILHHEQALEMAALVPERSDRDDVRLLARRVIMSQEAEIAVMRRWLRQRGEQVPAAGYGDHGGHADHEGMPGMLSPEQLEALAAASGEEFDRMFLEFMIFHHEGALTMVEELFSHPSAGQEGEIFPFATHVGSDQRIEIDRMYRMLERTGS